MSAEHPVEPVSLDLLLAHRDWVRALARRLVLDANDADDVEQETWRMAVERPPRHAESLRGWLATVVRNAARMSGRGATRRLHHEAAAPRRHEVVSPEDLVAAAELQSRLARAVLELDEPYRSTVLYRFHEDLGPTEIAARLGVPVETVKTRLKRAIERLRERMGVELGDERDSWCLLLVGMRAGDATRIAPTTAASVGATLGGGLGMSAAMKFVLTAGAIVVAGFAWQALPDDRAESSPQDATAEATPEAPPAAPPKPTVRRRELAAGDADTSSAVAASTSTTAQTFGPNDVHGRVIDNDTGSPVGDVVVALTNQSEPIPVSELSATTSGDGAFRVDYPGHARYQYLRLRADGYPTQLSTAPWYAEGNPRTKTDCGDVRIYRGKRIAGRVLTADGSTPVAGAQIRLLPSSPTSIVFWMLAPIARTSADDDGAFAFDRITPSPSWPYIVYAVAPAGVGWAKLAGDAGKVEARAEIVLRPSVALVVNVIDESGTPQAGVRVVATPRFEPLRIGWTAEHSMDQVGDRAIDAVFSSRADAQGVARFASLPIGEERSSYDVVAHGTTKGWTDGVAVVAGETSRADVVIRAATTWSISGIVRNDDGTPFAGALVKGGYSKAETRSGADGRFRIDGLDPAWEPYWFEVTAQSRVKVRRSATPDRKSGVVEVEIVMDCEAPVTGRVVDEAGKPVADVEVSGATTDSEGKFTLPSVSVRGMRLAVMPPPPYDEWRCPGQWPFVHGGEKDVVVLLPRSPAGTARVVAEVVDEVGAPLIPEEAFVLATEDDGLRMRFPQHGKIELATGRVVVERMKPGRWRLWVRVPSRIGAVASVDVGPGVKDIALRVVVGRPGKLRGRVDLADSGGAMPPMVIPSGRDDWTMPQWARPHEAKMIGAARVKPDGTFEFPEVMPGRWRIGFEDKGCIAEGFADVPAGGEADVVVVMAKASVLSFRIPASSPYFLIEIAQGAGPWRMTSGASVTVRPGTYRWRVRFLADASFQSGDSAAPASGEVTVGVGETAVVDVPVVAK